MPETSYTYIHSNWYKINILQNQKSTKLFRMLQEACKITRNVYYMKSSLPISPLVAPKKKPPNRFTLRRNREKSHETHHPNTIFVLNQKNALSLPPNLTPRYTKKKPSNHFT